ncbi:hypothetical protein BGHDH14_bgh02174 [Blumeria hordei DH14]|uniref:Uncharacterized protein n=1 Tax=Blumeria graminis f. sp. hordei (strain DH14) TaxID=546991 RepID=N1JFZ9_BLUG1|nr:hypothetical protein BGHDH14_bgh02174 [Blumeria hordei DH14]
MSARGKKPVVLSAPKPDVTTTNPTSSSVAPAVPAHVIYKLLAFTFAMMAGPISIYFFSLNRIFAGNSTYAGATAAITANVVLIGYVIVAFKEDQSEDLQQKKNE